MNLSYNFNNSQDQEFYGQKTGFHYLYCRKINNPSDKYDFKGDKNTLYTIYYNCLFKRFILFGEFSYSGSNKYALRPGYVVTACRQAEY